LRRNPSPSTGGKGRRRTYSLCWVCYEEAVFITGQKSKEAGSPLFHCHLKMETDPVAKMLWIFSQRRWTVSKYQSCLLPS
jgi:hypothetical protein